MTLYVIVKVKPGEDSGLQERYETGAKRSSAKSLCLNGEASSCSFGLCVGLSDYIAAGQFFAQLFPSKLFFLYIVNSGKLNFHRPHQSRKP